MVSAEQWITVEASLSAQVGNWEVPFPARPFTAVDPVRSVACFGEGPGATTHTTQERRPFPSPALAMVDLGASCNRPALWGL